MKKAIQDRLNEEMLLKNNTVLEINGRYYEVKIRENFTENHVINKETKQAYVGDLAKVQDLESKKLYIYGRVLTGQNELGMLTAQYVAVSNAELKQML